MIRIIHIFIWIILRIIFLHICDHFHGIRSCPHLHHHQLQLKFNSLNKKMMIWFDLQGAELPSDHTKNDLDYRSRIIAEKIIQITDRGFKIDPDHESKIDPRIIFLRITPTPVNYWYSTFHMRKRKKNNNSKRYVCNYTRLRSLSKIIGISTNQKTGYLYSGISVSYTHLTLPTIYSV